MYLKESISSMCWCSVRRYILFPFYLCQRIHFGRHNNRPKNCTQQGDTSNINDDPQSRALRRLRKGRGFWSFGGLLLLGSNKFTTLQPQAGPSPLRTSFGDTQDSHLRCLVFREINKKVSPFPPENCPRTTLMR